MQKDETNRQKDGTNGQKEQTEVVFGEVPNVVERAPDVLVGTEGQEDEVNGQKLKVKT